MNNLRLHKILKSQRGSALMTGLIIMMMVAIFVISFLGFTTNNLIRANRDEIRTNSFCLAEAGMEWAIDKVIGVVHTTTTIPSATYSSEVTTVLDGLKPGATGSVTVTPTSGGAAVFVSTATYKGVTQKIRVKMQLKTFGVWDNAIFAGIGQSGRGINGNVDIRGSVHILGEGEPYSDLNGNGVWDAAETYTDSNGNGVYNSGEPFTDSDHNGVWTPAEPYTDINANSIYDVPLTAADLAVDMSGSANIGNNYNGMPAGLSAKIPALTPITYGGENVQSLNAEVRVKHGKLALSGTAKAGQTNVTGNTVKETLDGVYVSNGYGGNKGATNVNSDNGPNNPYDLGDQVQFPNLSDPYTDPSTSISYTKYEDYLDAKSMVITENNIKTGVANFTHSDANGNSISWNDATDTLTITGIVRIAGDVDLSSKGDTIYFAGKGTIFSKGSVRVHGSVLPKTLFPTTDALGVIAKSDINFATGSGEAQLSGAGAWYAQRKIVSAKQNQFAGTYVADYFDMGTNVPSIYQVPTLSTNLPPGMPGSKAAISASTLSWKHIQ